MQTVIESCNPKRLVASGGAAWNGAGGLMGIFVAQASGTPTITVYDGSSASGTVLVNTFTPVAGTFYPMPFLFSVGCFVAITGTVDCTVALGPVTA